MNTNESITYETPLSILMDKEEGGEINAYRENALRYLTYITIIISYITSHPDPLVAAHSVSAALGLTEESMREIGRKINVSSGTISLNAKIIRQMLGLPPSLAQKSVEQAKESRITRNKQL